MSTPMNAECRGASCETRQTSRVNGCLRRHSNSSDRRPAALDIRPLAMVRPKASPPFGDEHGHGAVVLTQHGLVCGHDRTGVSTLPRSNVWFVD